MKHFLPSLAALVAALCALAPAQAQDKQQASAAYKDMCMQAVDMPKPFGEYDLKGNAKLDAYCGCFGAQFADNVMKVNPKAKPLTPDEATKRDLAMRNTCRQKLGLPLAK
jgi:hypothetical protein